MTARLVMYSNNTLLRSARSNFKSARTFSIVCSCAKVPTLVTKNTHWKVISRLSSTLTTPDSSFIVSHDNSSLLETVGTVANLASEPSLSSLGLASFTPKGFVQWGLESLHVGLDIPWWSAIVIGTICVRIAIFPLVIKAQKNAANMNNHMPTLQRLQQKMSVARLSANPQEAVETSRQMMEFMKINKINPLKNMLVPLAQLPIFLSVFTGLREMANLPVESLKTGGMLWFTDLSVADPIFLLPLVTAVTLYCTIEVGVDNIKASQVGSSTLKLVLRSMPFIAFPFMINFPSALLCYWFTSNAFTLIQVLFLRIPKVRSFFDIPEMIDHSSAHPLKEESLPKQSFMESFRQSMKNIELANEIEERKKLGALQMKKSSRQSSDSN